MMTCHWCTSVNVKETTNTVYWELPDGTKTIEIRETPCIECQDCMIKYQTDSTVYAIEEQMFLINTKLLEKTIQFQVFLQQPRLLKKNYFDFLK